MKKSAGLFLRALTAVLLLVSLMSSTLSASASSDGSKKVKTNLPLSYFSNTIAAGSSTAKVYSTDKVTTVTFYDPYKTKNMTYYAGTFKGDVDGQAASFYCIDLAHPLAEYSESQPHTYTDQGPTPLEITYILNHYYPLIPLPYSGSLSTPEKEAAAVQLAIWHYSDNVNLSTITDNTLKQRALAIQADADANAASYVPFETLIIIPTNQNLINGTAGQFSVSAFDLNGNPLSGINVTLSVTTGSLSATGAVTGSGGTTADITINQGSSNTSTIKAVANVTIPQGTKYVHKVSPNEYQKLVLATPAGLTREVYSTINWYTPADCDTKGFTTFTQGGWGSPSNSAPGKIRDLYFSSVFPSGLTVGSVYTITLTSASAVKDFLPQGNTAAPLTRSYVNPDNKINILAGQLVALTLNVEFDKAGKIGSNPVDLGNLYILGGAFEGKTVSQFLAIANKALGGESTGYSISDINNTATAINENFDNGTSDEGFLTCKTELKSSLGDRVWEDTNKNGIQDAGEQGIANVTVKLYDCSGNLLAQTTTDANGYYLFGNLNAGSYTVQFVKPSGYTFTIQDANSNGSDGTDSDADVTTGKTTCIALAAGENDMTWDAGLYKPETEKADLKIEKSVDNSTPKNNDIITYTIKVTNLGPNTSYNVSATDLLPSGLIYQSSSASQGAYNNTTGVWSVGDLANGAYATLSISVKVDVADINNSAFDLGPAKEFGLFVLQDLTQPSADTEGKVAVGHDAVLANYSIADKLQSNSGDVLVVGHDLTYTSGAVYNGNVVYGNTTNLPINAVTISGGALRKDYPIDFGAAAVYLEDLSTQLSSYSVNGSATMQWGGIDLKGIDPYLNVFKVNGSDLSTANNVSITVPNGSVVLVNIDGADVKWSGGLTVNGTAISNVLYNFYQASNLTIQGIDVRGSVLAPFAALNFPAGVVNGQVIVKSMNGSGQFNNTIFQGHIPTERKITNIAVLNTGTTPDPVSDNNSSSVLITVSNLTMDGGNGGTGSGNNWQSAGSFTQGEIIYTMIYDNAGNIYAGTMGGKIYKSTNGGSNWSLINSGMNVNYIWSLNISGSTLYAATDKGVFKYDGSSWNQAGLADKDVHAIASYNGILYAGTWGYGVFTSSDNGANWTELNNGLGGFLAIQSLTVSTDGTVFVGTAGYGVLKLTSGQWVKSTAGYDVVWSLTSSGGYIYAGTYGNGLMKSSDNGSTWMKVNSLNISYIYALTADASGKVYASSYTSGVMVSSDNGSTWSSLGMSGYGVSTVIVNPSTSDIYAGTKEGVIYKISGNTQVTATDRTQEIPTTYQLSQNYPNPFNPTTTIQFAVPQASRITIRVFNAIGQEVAVLADQEYSAGVHKVNFDASRLASGMYIYQMIGKNLSITKKMMLLK